MIRYDAPLAQPSLTKLVASYKVVGGNLPNFAALLPRATTSAHIYQRYVAQ